MESNAPSTEKTTIFNLIILDESGSMCNIVDQTLSGCNETINVIKNTAAMNPYKVRSLVSIFAFQSGSNIPSRYLIKNAKPEEVKPITHKDYKPTGMTPLLDAVGSTLSELKTVSETHENSTGIVTIITDGYENSSRHYTWQTVAKLISQLKELGWTINLIGANIDVDQMASQMNIDNKMSFTATAQGSVDMYDALNSAVGGRYEEIMDEEEFLDIPTRVALRRSQSRGFFDKRKL